ncbi:MAG: 2-oxoglutarate dehydrogenase complex dihydrolipoyllysine-residue succinyltransferase [Trueperaceae bacterium]|nr:2-oxoglutarate dehydrogenase complex dihydrolipoyllysine-residue succinyltransferase [Trueperaceae bacterium]
MSTEVKVPAAGESITEVVIGAWLKRVGDSVKVDEPLVEIETEKATLEVPSPVAGVITEQLKAVGDPALVGEVIARIDASAVAASAAAPAAPTNNEAPKPAETAPAAAKPAAAKPSAPVAAAPAAPAPKFTPATSVMPAAQRLLDEHGLSADEVSASGPGGRLLKEDVQRHLAQRERSAAQPDAALVSGGARGRREEVVAMSPLRRTIATRLVEAQHTAALLTTFNEVDMSGVMALRNEHKDAFEKRYGVRLGFMSFFVKAAIDALKLVPQINAEIRGNSIVYKDYYDIGVAVSSKKGLVVPIIRNADRLSFAEVEAAIADFGKRGTENKIAPEELLGGTFTISNGGVFGSLLSTPIVNPPQSGVLGMHSIQDRPIALDGQVVIRPMMYIALTYDHRIVDGREAVTFLKRIKQAVEQPTRMLLEV